MSRKSGQERNVRRLCVRDPSGVWSSVWRIWTNRDDVYVAYSAAQSSVKISLHRSGSYRLAYTSEEVALAAGRGPGEDRAVAKWTKPMPVLTDLTHVFTIRIPTSELRSVDAGQANAHDALWVNPAPTDSAVYFNIFISGHPDPSDWPGKRAMRTMLVGRLRLESGEEVQVTGHSEPMDRDVVGAIEGEKLRLFRDRWNDLREVAGTTFRGHILHCAQSGEPVITDVAFDIPLSRPTWSR